MARITLNNPMNFNDKTSSKSYSDIIDEAWDAREKLKKNRFV